MSYFLSRTWAGFLSILGVACFFSAIGFIAYLVETYEAAKMIGAAILFVGVCFVAGVSAERWQ